MNTPQSRRKTVLIAAASLIAYAAFLLMVFLSIGFGSRGHIDVEGWLLMAGLLAVVGAGGFGVWRITRSDPSSATAPLMVGAAIALLIGIASIVQSSRDLLTVTIPMFLLAMSLFILPRLSREAS